jgi:general L-amino acid transport system permease protein
MTFLLAIAGLAISFPIGIMLALARTSSMPIFRLLSTGYIETIRGVPLITVLFFGNLVINRFLPREVELDNVVKAVVAIALLRASTRRRKRWVCRQCRRLSSSRFRRRYGR